MLDLNAQKEILLQRLSYYRMVMNERPEGYRTHKQTFSIPNTERALAKLESGTYGFCEECGAQIPEDRLRAVPAALRCRDCQVDVEV